MLQITKVLPSIVASVLVFAPGYVMAEEKTLTADEVKNLFSGKTFDGHNEIRDKNYRAYSKADGKMIHKNARRTKEVPWEVTSDGRHCVKFRQNYCGSIISMGNGVYHKMRDGTHINTLKNFVDGNKL